MFLLIFILAVSLLCFPSCAGQNTSDLEVVRPCEPGLVVFVYDGDTIRIRFANGDEAKVRLIGVDAPEMNAVDKKEQFCAFLSKRFVFHSLFRKQVRLSYGKEHEDKYGRTLALLWTDHGELFNEWIIKEGYAEAYLKFPFRNELRQRFIRSEKEAKDQKKELWTRKPYPVIPAEKAEENVGRVISIRMICTGVKKTEDFVFLEAGGTGFTALVQGNRVPQFGDLKRYKGKTMNVSGYVESYKGKPQIIIFSQRQIELITGENLKQECIYEKKNNHRFYAHGDTSGIAGCFLVCACQT